MRKLLCCMILILCCLLSCCVLDRDVSADKKQALDDLPGVKDVYENVLLDYANLVTYRLSDEFETKWNANGELPIGNELKAAISDTDAPRDDDSVPLSARWSNMIVEMPKGLESAGKHDFGYVYWDVNSDHADELFWVRSDGMILAVFTVYNEKLVLLDSFWTRYRCEISESGAFHTVSAGGTAYGYDVRTLGHTGALAHCQEFGFDSAEYYSIVQGKKTRITEEDFLKLRQEFSLGQTWPWNAEHTIWL